MSKHISGPGEGPSNSTHTWSSEAGSSPRLAFSAFGDVALKVRLIVHRGRLQGARCTCLSPAQSNAFPQYRHCHPDASGVRLFVPFAFDSRSSHFLLPERLAQGPCARCDCVGVHEVQFLRRIGLSDRRIFNATGVRLNSWLW